jgi:hypothetical protein
MMAARLKPSRDEIDYSRRHLVFGWWSLLAFAVLGLTLEALHGFKVRGYLDASNDTRRLMWTLAHAHGIGLALVHIGFGLMLRVAPETAARNVQTVSLALIVASVALPGGFFLGGIGFYAGDPGVGVALVPAGAAALLYALAKIARAARD